MKEAAFDEGFEQAYRAIKGNEVPFPTFPPEKVLVPGRSAFQSGILAGLEAALGKKHHAS